MFTTLVFLKVGFHCVPSLYDFQWLSDARETESEPLILAFRALFLVLFIIWQSHSALLTPFWPHQGLFSLQPNAQLVPAPEVTSPASCVQLYSKLNLNATCSLKPSLTTKSHSVISLLSSSLGSPRTCLLNWTLTHKNIVFSSHLRLITCFGHPSCMLVGPYHLLNKQINRWNTLAYSCHWFFKWLALKCILQISGWH